MEDKEMEQMATAISGAVLFPLKDARRELGIRSDTNVWLDFVTIDKTEIIDKF